MSDIIDMLERCKGKEIIVKLKDGTECRGILVDCDYHLNLIMKRVIEVKGDSKLAYGNQPVLIRGNNVMWIETEAAREW